MKVNKLLTSISVLVVGLLMSMNVSAYYAYLTPDPNEVRTGDGTVLGTDAGDYLGYIGNVQDGVTIANPPPIPPTFYQVSTRRSQPDGAGSGPYVTNSNAFFTDTGDNVHWYDFSLTDPTDLALRFEAGASMAFLDISFFFEADDTLVYNERYNNGDPDANFGGHWNDIFTNFDRAGDWWMRIEGELVTGAESSGYTVTLAAVPLPPAILLFGSAIVGFGVMGRKKIQRQLS